MVGVGTIVIIYWQLTAQHYKAENAACKDRQITNGVKKINQMFCEALWLINIKEKYKMVNHTIALHTVHWMQNTHEL